MPLELKPANQDAATNSQPVTQSEIDVAIKVLEGIRRQWAHLPATTPMDTMVKLELYPHELDFIQTLLKWNKCEEWRNERRYYKRHPSLEALAEESEKTARTGRKSKFSERLCAADSIEESLEHAEQSGRFHEALLELPIQLAVIARVLPEVQGNVSELARRLGQPQRKTARQVRRIQKHLVSRGFEA